ncbi:hypothetical protein BD779DRAFT_534413 [Infundibulicybe gibba]|nr:hypothetical protein BD779DRAFT_534413 [Infundibulicybe gibba]
MFLGPHIRKMQLSVSGDSDQNCLLSTLGRRCPSLAHFELVTINSYPDIGRQMESLLPQWGQLETLVIRYLPEEALRIVAALPHLHSLTLSYVVDDHGNTFSPTPGTDVFPALQDLSITANSSILCINLLKAAINCPLVEFKFSLFGLNPPTWHDLFAELYDKSTLAKVEIDDLEIQHNGRYPGTTDELRLLFSLTNLIHLDLETRYGFDIDDAFVYEMAAAWPCIQILNIEATKIFQPFEPQRLTLQGLAPLADHCPDLWDLRLHVNVAQIRSKHFDMCSGSSRSRVQFLGVGRSPISKKSVPWAAVYLSVIFPRLRAVDYTDGYEGHERPAYPDRWSDVNSHLLVYRHVRDRWQNDSRCSNCGLDAT